MGGRRKALHAGELLDCGQGQGAATRGLRVRAAAPRRSQRIPTRPRRAAARSRPPRCAQVYDVTTFAPDHPGGSAILAYGGRDASDVFAAFHAAGTRALLKQFYIGDVQVRGRAWRRACDARRGCGALPARSACLEPAQRFEMRKCTSKFPPCTPPPPAPATRAAQHARRHALVQAVEPDPMLRDFRRLRGKLIRDNLFVTSKSFYAWKVLSLLGMFLTVATILWHGGNSWPATVAAACLLAISWQQSGWLAHDFLHHQVFTERAYNNVVGYVVGNVVQGFSVDWWKNKHNKHHAVPNECTEGAEAVDPGARLLAARRAAEVWGEGPPSHTACVQTSTRCRCSRGTRTCSRTCRPPWRRCCATSSTSSSRSSALRASRGRSSRPRTPSCSARSRARACSRWRCWRCTTPSLRAAPLRCSRRSRRLPSSFSPRCRPTTRPRYLQLQWLA